MTPTKPTTVTEVTEADRALCRRLRDQKDATPKSPRFEMGYEQAIVEIAAHRAAAVEAACKPLLDALEKIARETYSMIDAGAIAEKALRQHAQPPAQQEATDEIAAQLAEDLESESKERMSSVQSLTAPQPQCGSKEGL